MRKGLFIFRGDLIVNAVVPDPTEQWQQPEDCWVMEIPDDCSAGINWRYVDGAWIAPPPPPEPEEVEEEVL